MDFYLMSDKGIEEELGNRIKALRLRKNVTQEALAQATMLSVNTIKSLESGRGKLATVIAVLRELGMLEQLNQFISQIPISPMQIAQFQGVVKKNKSGVQRRTTNRLQKKVRQRASGHRQQQNPTKKTKQRKSKR